jgi:hypothetical protein
LLVLHHAGLVPCVAEPEQVSSILPWIRDDAQLFARGNRSEA